MAKFLYTYNIGQIQSEPHNSVKISWVIRNYISLPQEPRSGFLSPGFIFLGVKWCLGITQTNDTNNWIEFSVARDPSTNIPIHRIFCKMSIVKNNGKVYVSHSSTENFQENTSSMFLFFQRSQFLRDKDEIMLNGNLTIHCLLIAEDGVIDLSDAEDSSVTTTVEVKKESKTECSLADAKETLSNPTGTLKLSQDFKELLLNGSHSDTTIKIKNREFRAHRAILSSRSQVFGSMFCHDTTERNTGTIEIKDCAPEEFEEFLSFLYSGVLENLTSENVFDLFTLADKYDVQEVKAQCLAFMTSNLSVDTFCDVITVAVRHNELQLLETAKEFFVQNARRIAVTPKWLCFHKEHPIESNELLIKLSEYRDRQ